jgi:hypothetical protein
MAASTSVRGGGGGVLSLPSNHLNPRVEGFLLGLFLLFKNRHHVVFLILTRKQRLRVWWSLYLVVCPTYVLILSFDIDFSKYDSFVSNSYNLVC